MANCVALYHVMKVAIPEELAMVLVRRAVFGPERRRDWFQDKLCYYTETENSIFAIRLLYSYPDLIKSHHAAFGLQAYQALGSSCHQARLHELGLLEPGDPGCATWAASSSRSREGPRPPRSPTSRPSSGGRPKFPASRISKGSGWRSWPPP